jgi:two-component system osmolarity sensor histidine kinase EnvZ
MRSVWRRLDSLFMRLLMAQVLIAVMLLALLATVFIVDRNHVLADLYAERWAPSLAEAGGYQAALEPPQTVRRSDVRPSGPLVVNSEAPRIAALRAALIRRGIPVDQVAVTLSDQDPVVWVHVVRNDGSAQWLGIDGHVVVNNWSQRVMLALFLGLALLAAVSYLLTRWLTRPLEKLRNHMQAQLPGAPPVGPMDRPADGAAPEIEQIGLAFADLQERQARFERERAVLLAGVSHDLRSPLGRIRMAAELLPDAPDTAARREAIVRNVKACDRLIESFLDFVRSGELAFDETVDLAAAARSATAGFDRPPAELSVEGPAALPWPRANRLLFERLVANLVDNAFKHGRTPVKVRVGGDAQAAWLEVEDAGAGLAEGSNERVQEAFVRGDASRATPGTGLGLAVVRQVALRLGGQVSFAREAGRHRVRVRLARAA